MSMDFAPDELVKWLTYCADVDGACRPGCECPFYTHDVSWCCGELMKEAARRLSGNDG